MMEAVHIELLPQMLDQEIVPPGEEIYADSEEFVQATMRAGHGAPSAASGSSPARFRLFLKVGGKSELTGVYYVSGWRDRKGTATAAGPVTGLVHLCRDDDQGHIIPRRREAIMATRAKG